MRRLDRDHIKRVVVRGTNWVGDAVMTVPALRELRRLLPDAHITLAARTTAKDVLEGADFLDEILICDSSGHEFSSPFRQAREWRRRRFDLAVLLQNAFETALIAFMARVPLRIGYATQGRSLILSYPLPLPEWRRSRHESFYYLNIIAGLERILTGHSEMLDQEPVFALTVTDERQSVALDIIRSHGFNEDRPLIALCPGSINSRAKRWPTERFAALANRLIEELDANVVLIGSEAELDVSLEVSRQMRHQPIILTGKTGLAQAVAVLSLVDLLVTNDTGPAHVAAALDRPTLVIFGPTNPLTTSPYSAKAETIRHPPDCAPCMLRDCPIDHRCMTAISPDEVFDRALRMLEAKSDKLQFVEIGGSSLPSQRQTN